MKARNITKVSYENFMSKESFPRLTRTKNFSYYFLFFLFRFFLSFLGFFGFHFGPVPCMPGSDQSGLDQLGLDQPGLDQPGMNVPWCWFKSSSVSQKSTPNMPTNPQNAPPRMPPETPFRMYPRKPPRTIKKYLSFLERWICETCVSNSSSVSKKTSHFSQKLKWKLLHELLTWLSQCL